MTRYIYHPGTQTFFGLEDAVIIDVPETITDGEEIEEFLTKTDTGLPFLALPMTAFDNAVFELDGSQPDLELRSTSGQNLWLGLGELSIKIKHDDEGVVVDVYDDLDAEATASTWAMFPQSGGGDEDLQEG